MDNFFIKFAGLSRKREVGGISGNLLDGHQENTQQAAPKNSGGNWTEQIAPVGGRNSLLVPAWYRGVSLIMQTMGQMLVQYQRRSKEGGNYREDLFGPSGRLNYMLQVRPNPLMTASQMLEQVEFRKIYNGNAYIFIEYDWQGDLNALWLCSSGAYDIVSDSYSLTYNRPGGVSTLTGVPAEQVLHFRNVFLRDDMIEGVPAINYAVRALQISATADKQSLHDMAKGGKQKLLVTEKAPETGSVGMLSGGRADQDEMRSLAERLGEDWMSQDAVFVDNLADAKVISQTAAELRLLETRGFQVADIARVLGVPKVMMMDDSNSSYKTPEAATQEFLLRTIQPRVREMEDEMNSKLVGMQDFGKRRIHICEKALRRLDPASQARLDKTHLETGAYTPNEIRAQYDLPSVQGGDTNYLSANLAELGSEKLRKDSPSAATPRDPEKDGEEEKKGGDE